MAPPHLSFVFGDGSRATVACDSGTLTRICGPVLAPLLDDDDGTHLDVPELDDLDHAAPVSERRQSLSGFQNQTIG